MRRLFSVGVVTWIFCCSAVGQLASVSASVYKPGEIVRLKITFEHSAILESGYLYFDLKDKVDGNDPKLITHFGGNGGELQRLSNNEYLIGERVMKGVANGKYVLTQILADSNGVRRTYEFDKDFKEAISIQVINPDRPSLPDIKDIDLQPKK